RGQGGDRSERGARCGRGAEASRLSRGVHGGVEGEVERSAGQPRYGQRRAGEGEREQGGKRERAVDPSCALGRAWPRDTERCEGEQSGESHADEARIRVERVGRERGDGDGRDGRERRRESEP